MCCGKNHSIYSLGYAPLMEDAKIYRLENNRIVGEIPLSQLRTAYYGNDSRNSTLGLVEAASYLSKPNKRESVFEHESIEQKRESLLALIERARSEQIENTQWQ